MTSRWLRLVCRVRGHAWEQQVCGDYARGYFVPRQTGRVCIRCGRVDEVNG